jgi:signal transduction histidine kinase
MRMTIYSRKRYWKYALFLLAACIGVFTLYYTSRLVDELKLEERKKIQLWAEATKKLADADISYENLDFLLQVVQDNTNIPVILADESDNIISYRNIDSASVQNDSLYLMKQLRLMKKNHTQIKVSLYDKKSNFIYYKDSLLLTRINYYPFIQLGLVMIFILISYLAFSAARNSEQNQVWVGLSKETAHQLGTPTSSLMACVEMLKEKNFDSELTKEIIKDVERLEVVTARFSNIGSKPVLKDTKIKDVINDIADYLRSRVSAKIKILTDFPVTDMYIPLNTALFEWVIENVCKNAIDAIGDEGTITISIKANLKKLFIDIADTGKGIPRGDFNTIFKPGYTTKSRGWGLGLSLTKRIVEQYHHGKIYVLNSEVNKGTTIRIELKP